ncbi:hypothetical protein C7212DRAFT_354826 [Tuber magnatum]|uniref:WW domain-containing protein n=1 Tax=Tuber magnatum TaxID=42249 RepID=A0A317SBU0_9PEZI|nr:hypothetical protein C7212DRAFT_354826 [Tuber magnatum]
MSSIKNKLHNIVADVRETKVAAQSHNVGSYHAPPASDMHGEQHFPPPPPRSLPHGWTARFDEKEGKFAYCMGVDGVEQWELRSVGCSRRGEGRGSGGCCAGNCGRWDCWYRGWHRPDH